METEHLSFTEAAETLGITASRLKTLGLIDKIIGEPLGGAHSNYDAAAAALKEAIVEAFSELSDLSAEQLVEDRYQKFARIGRVG